MSHKEGDSPCSNPECNRVYPYYGVAPHECYWKKPGGVIGDSTIDPLDNWPDNFFAEWDNSLSVEENMQYGLCGIWACPECKAMGVSSENLKSKDEIKALLEHSGS